MRPITRTLASSATLACLPLLAVACGGSKPSVASEAVTAARPATNTTTPGAPATSPTAANISISDEIRAKCGIPDAEAYFSFDSAQVTSNDRTPLDLVVRCFTKGALAGHAVKLVGRADPRGAPEYNLTLGQSRADAVGLYLDGRGMSRAKTQSTSRGAMDATGMDESSWQRDRRVDVILGD